MEGNLNCYRKRARTDPAPLADDAGEAGDANAREASCQRLKPQRTKHHPGACRMIPAKLGMQKLPFAPRPKKLLLYSPQLAFAFQLLEKKKDCSGCGRCKAGNLFRRVFKSCQRCREVHKKKSEAKNPK